MKLLLNSQLSFISVPSMTILHMDYIYNSIQHAQHFINVDNIIAYTLATCAIVYIWRSVHQAVFTPLWKIPGPYLNAFTNIPLKYHTFRGQYSSYTTKLHEKYGEIVRVGYNQISVSNVSELRHILSTHKYPKSPHFERGLSLPPTVFSTANPELNKTRRRQMGPMYSMPTVRLLEDSVIEAGAKSLMAEWDKKIMGQNAVVNYFYGFHGVAVDIIGVLGFGQSFNIAQTGDSRIIDGMHQSVALVVMRSCFRLLHQFPWIAKPYNDGRLYVTRVANKAIANRHKENALGVKHIDILQKLIDARDTTTGAQIEGEHLTSEILLLLIAGTDTTSNTLTWTLMHLLHHPHILQQVQHDIRHTFPDASTPIRYDQARELPLLTAILYESMRLHSAVSGYLPRIVPHTGATLDSYYLPPTTEICVSFAACHRNKNTWPDPDRFIPDRFMGHDAELRKRDILAFGSGVRMCAGRNLAWIELYTILANVLRRYEFEVPENALYGPNRTLENESPECIPGLSFTTFGPANPSRHCNVKISLAPC